MRLQPNHSWQWAVGDLGKLEKVEWVGGTTFPMFIWGNRVVLVRFSRIDDVGTLSPDRNELLLGKPGEPARRFVFATGNLPDPNGLR